MYSLLLTNFTPPLSQTVTNLGPRSLKDVTFSTYIIITNSQGFFVKISRYAKFPMTFFRYLPQKLAIFYPEI